nr:hypothetical protein [Tanacetum cinerariifolium]
MRKNTQVPQPSGSTKNVADEVVHNEWGNKLVRATTSASSLEAEQSVVLRYHGDTIAQTRFENVSKFSNDLLLARGHTLRSDDDRMKLNELIELCTNLQSRVLDLEKTKTTQALEFTSLKGRVKKLEKNQRRKINDIDADEDITLVNDQDDVEMFNVNDLHGEEVFVRKEVADKEINDEVQKVVEEVVEDINTAKLIDDAAQVSTAGEVNASSIATTFTATAIITTEEITLAQALMEIKTSRPKAKGIVLHEPKDPVKLKKKDQIRLDKAAALKLQAELQAEFDKEQRLEKERAKKELEANIALIKT